MCILVGKLRDVVFFTTSSYILFYHPSVSVGYRASDCLPGLVCLYVCRTLYVCVYVMLSNICSVMLCNAMPRNVMRVCIGHTYICNLKVPVKGNEYECEDPYGICLSHRLNDSGPRRIWAQLLRVFFHRIVSCPQICAISAVKYLLQRATPGVTVAVGAKP